MLSDLLAKVLREAYGTIPPKPKFEELTRTSTRPQSMAARLMKGAPSVQGPPLGSWYCGMPCFAESVDWPMHDNKPMVFLAQIACEKLPKNIWNGSGPRDGWILYFMAASDKNNQMVAKVLYVRHEGPKRTMPLDASWAAKCDWISRDFAKRAPASATPFPHFPIDMIPKAKGAPEPKPNTKPTSSHWPGGAAGHPISWELLDTFLEHVQKAIERTPNRIDEMIARVEKTITEISARPENARKYWDVYNLKESQRALEQLHFERDRILRGQADFPKLVAQLGKGRQGIGPSMEIWLSTLENLSRIPDFWHKWETVSRHYNPVCVTSFKKIPVNIERPETILKLLQAMGKSFKSVTDFGVCKARIESFEKAVNRPLPTEFPSPEVETHMRTAKRVKEQNYRNYMEARAWANELRKPYFELRRILNKIPTQTEIGDREWAEIQIALAQLTTLEKATETVLDGIPAMQNHIIRHSSFAEPNPDTYCSWRIEFSREQNREALRLATENPDAIPNEVAAHFGPIWASQTAKHFDGMGGEARWDSMDFSWFSPGGRPEPFDGENAVLLELFSDSLMGWQWGDMSYVVFLTPFMQISNTEFTDVVAIIQG